MSNEMVAMNIKYPCHLSSSDWDSLWFDDSRQRYILMKNSVFYLWAPWFNGSAFPDPVKFFTLPSSGFGQSLGFLRPAAENIATVLYAQLSLDSQLFAVQLSATKVLVSDLKVKRNWTVEIKTPMDNKILSKGLVWSDHGGNSQDLVIVTRRGLELYKISSARGQCKLSRTVSQRITAFFYEPNHRFFLLSCPPPSTTGGDMVSILQFEMNGYFLNINNHDKEAPANTVRFELLPPSRSPSFELAQGALAKCSIKDGFESMHVVSLYGTVFYVCRMHLSSSAAVHRDPENKVNDDVLVCYAVKKASVVATHVCFLNCVLASKLRLSVVDNLLLCHVNVAEHPRRTIVFDIALSTTSSQRVYIAPSTSESTPAYLEYVDPLCAPVLTRFGCPAGGPSAPVPAAAGAGGQAGGHVAKKDSWDALGEGSGPVAGAADGSPSKGREGMPGAAGAVAAGTPARRRSNASLEQAVALYTQQEAERKAEPDAASSEVAAPTSSGAVSAAAAANLGSSAGGGGMIHVSDDNDNRLRYLAPCWIWDKEKRCQWQIQLPVAEIAAVIERTDGPRRMCKFLLNRGQFVVAPRPIPIVNRDDCVSVTKDAKACLLSYMHRYVGVQQLPLALLGSLFQIIVRPYVSEVQRSVSAPNSSSVPSSPSSSAAEQDRGGPVSGSPPMADVEPSVALQQLVVEITAIKGRFRKGVSGLPQARLATSSLDRLGLSNVAVAASRRSWDGALIVSQFDMLERVWLPLLRALSDCDPDSPVGRTAVERLTASLSAYIALLRGSGLVVHPTLSLTLFNHMLSYGSYVEACRLLQFQFFPDASELALAALELSAELQDSQTSTTAAGRQTGSALGVSAMVRTLQQAGVDMLWRLEERAMAVRWLLGRGDVAEAMHVCTKRKGAWRKGLPPSAIPGADFFVAAVACVNVEHTAMLAARKVAAARKKRMEEEQAELCRLQMEEQKAELAAMQGDDAALVAEAEVEEVKAAAPAPSVVEVIVDPGELAAESRRARLFYSLHSFLKEWDYGLLTINQSTGKSKLASLVSFPDYAFELDDRTCRILKEMFGF